MTTATEVLWEYEQRDLPISEATAFLLARAAGDRLSVGIGSRPATWSIRAQQYVGTVSVPGLQLLIRPKVRPENLLLLLSAGMAASDWRPERFAYARSPDLLPAVADFYVRLVEQVLTGGVLRGYRQYRERLPALRGRIDLATQLRLPALRYPVACEFDEYTADTTENRVLKTALRRLLRLIGLSFDARRRIMLVLGSFEEVSDESDLAVAERVVWTRLNQRYRPALELATIILRNGSLRDQAGKQPASAFLVDMNDLYQRFVGDRLGRYLRPPYQLRHEPPVRLDLGGKVVMRPDYVIDRGGNTVYVADAKYKLTWTGQARSHDYYQLLAYLTAMELPAGALIYCTSEGEKPPRRVDVVQNRGALWTYQVDLGGPAVDVENSLRQLAAWVQESVTPVKLAPA